LSIFRTFERRQTSIWRLPDRSQVTGYRCCLSVCRHIG